MGGWVPKKVGLLFLAIPLVVFVLMLLHPVNRSLFRLLLVGSGVLTFGGILLQTGSSRMLRGILITVLVISVVMLSLPGEKRINPVALRDAFIAQVHGYEGTRYLWGGENRLGIDCSGLPRASLRKALLFQGVRTANGYLLRSAIRNWWFDASAKAMLNRYREDTLRIGDALNIASADHSMLRAGDMAITDGGVHCLVYVGDRKWVQADPSATKVIEVDAADSDNYWLRHPVEFIRWRILSGE